MMSASTLDSNSGLRADTGSSRDIGAHSLACAADLRRVEQELDELEVLTSSMAPVERFEERILQSACDSLGAMAAAVWLGDECLAERSSADQPAQRGLCWPTAVDRARLIRDAVSARKTAVLRPDQGEMAAAPGPTVIAPFGIDEVTAGAVELRFEHPLLPMQADSVQRGAEAYAELAGDFYRRQCLRRLQECELEWRLLEQFARRIHRPTLVEVAIAVVNEAQSLIPCDRVSLLDCGTRKCSLLAVTGVDQIDRRTTAVYRLQVLAAAVAANNHPLWPIDEARPPQLENALAEYLEVSNARAVVALPLLGKEIAAPGESSDETTSGEDASGVIVFEWHAIRSLDQPAQERIRRTVDHIEAAVRNVQHTERLPLIGLCRFLAQLRWLVRARRRPLAAATFAVIAAVAILCLTPAEWRVSAEGRLQPVQRREIFAPADAVVDAVFVDQGDAVDVGQPLLRLRSAPLEFEKTRLDGEIQTAQKRLTALQTVRLQKAERGETVHRQLQLTAEEEEVKLQLNSLVEQRQLVDEQLDQLDVCAAEAGEVLTWDAKHALAGRPVRRGQLLLSIGKVAGRWEVELRVPDNQAGAVMEAVEQGRRENRAVAVDFMVAGEPYRTYPGQIQRIACRTEVDQDLRQPVVLVTVGLLDEFDNPHPGAVILARIDCGRRSLAHVWFGETWNAVRRRLLF